MTISATIIQDSISNGVRITTFELEYPRFIHSELMTHRMFSRNAASSRAIPVKVMNENISNNPATPIHWGQNQPGMSAKVEVDDSTRLDAIAVWNSAKEGAILHSNKLAELGIHKQVGNRLCEAFTTMKTIVTATEWANWYDLRAHEDAQPEIHALAVEMYKAHLESVPEHIVYGEWHVPYVHRERLVGKMTYSVNDILITLEEAKMVSASCCAQVSYRKNDDSLDKAKMVFDRLITSVPMHASPIEHQCSPMGVPSYIGKGTWETGITHMDKNMQFWSGNMRGWLQYRQLI